MADLLTIVGWDVAELLGTALMVMVVLVLGFVVLEALFLLAWILFLTRENPTTRRRQSVKASAVQRLRSAGLLLLTWVASGQALAQEANVYRPPTPHGLDAFYPVPDSNPLTPEKVALGRLLFFDSLLSQDGTVACASCHQPQRAFTDGRPMSIGVFGRQGTRSVPTLVNRAYGTAFFWDGRTRTLEEQVLRPIQDVNEMDMPLDEVVTRLRRNQQYRDLFIDAFGRKPHQDDLARALASYVRTILSGNAPIDRYLYGERDALSQPVRQGLRIFRGRGNCTTCHVGPTFSDENFHNTGVAWRDGALLDSGRYVVSVRDEDLGAFKTPTLREVARTAPYMHDGSIATLEEVIEFYDRGGNANPYLDEDIRPLNLTEEEKAALVVFLRSLSGTVQEGLREY